MSFRPSSTVQNLVPQPQRTYRYMTAQFSCNLPPLTFALSDPF